MYNRYIGNTGKYYQVHEAHDRLQPEKRPEKQPYKQPHHEPQPVPEQTVKPPFAKKGGLENILKSLLPNGVGGIDTGDILLLLILFLLWRESEDEDFLIILIVIGISIFKDH